MTAIEITQWQELPHSVLYKIGAAVPEFLSLVLYGGDLTLHSPANEKKLPISTGQKGWWAIGLVWKLGETDKSYCPCQDSNSNPSGVQAAVGPRYTYPNTRAIFQTRWIFKWRGNESLDPAVNVANRPHFLFFRRRLQSCSHWHRSWYTGILDGRNLEAETVDFATVI